MVCFRQLVHISSTILIAAGLANAQSSSINQWARDPKQALDQPYTGQIEKYTTGPTLNSPLTDYLPASKTVPRPRKYWAMSPARPICCPTPKTPIATSGCSRNRAPRV